MLFTPSWSLYDLNVVEIGTGQVRTIDRGIPHGNVGFSYGWSPDGSPDFVSSYTKMREDGTAYGMTWAEEGFHRLGGTLWTHRSRFIENSPLFFLDRVETPVLITHGTEDVAVPVEQGDMLFVSLRRLGKTVEYARYAGEDHVPQRWSFANQIDYWTRVLGWFERFLEARDLQ